jgi:hypothetical protein
LLRSLVWAAGSRSSILFQMTPLSCWDFHNLPAMDSIFEKKQDTTSSYHQQRVLLLPILYSVRLWRYKNRIHEFCKQEVYNQIEELGIVPLSSCSIKKIANHILQAYTSVCFKMTTNQTRICLPSSVPPPFLYYFGLL